MQDLKNEKSFKIRGPWIVGLSAIVAAVLPIIYAKNEKEKVVTSPPLTIINQIEQPKNQNQQRTSIVKPPFVESRDHQPSSTSLQSSNPGVKIEPVISFKSFVNQNTSADIAVAIINTGGEFVGSINGAIINLYRSIGMTGTGSLFTPSFFQSKYFNDVFNINQEVLSSMGVNSLVKYIAVGKYFHEFEQGQYMKYVCHARLDMVIISTTNLQEVNRFTITVSGSHEDKFHAEAAAIEKLTSNYQYNHLKGGI
jgi:hypothetical protein